jgi:hypothetical protein
MVKLFICHASEDKDEVARPLANALREEGYDVWFDEFDLKLGDNLVRGINQGIIDSDYGIVIFSHAFFNKKWPKDELEGLIAKETDDKTIILPIWHRITTDDMKKNFPLLSNRVAATTDQGFRKIIEQIKLVVDHANVKYLQDVKIPFSISDIEKKKDWIFASVNKTIVERGSQIIFRGSTNAHPEYLYLNIFRLDDDNEPGKVFNVKTKPDDSFEFPVNTYPFKKGQYGVLIELPTGEYTKLSFLLE